ncbi:MAG: hypothetical protein ACRD25_10515 [Terracidiphilus sp.]
MRPVGLLLLASAAISMPCVPVRAQQACTLLTAAQVSAVAGGAMQQASGLTSATGCSWGGGSGAARRNVSLSIRPSAEYDTVKGRLGSMIVPVSALGDGAFFFPTRHNNAILYLLKGPHVYMLSVSVGANSQQQNEDAEKTLAAQMLPKL